MSEIKLYKSSSKGLKLIAMCLPFVIIGIWMIAEKPIGSFDYIVAWICMMFFGLAIPFGLFTIFDKRPQIIVDENGVWDRAMRQEKIKWEQITDSYLININNQNFISIAVDETFEIKKNIFYRLSKLNKFLGYHELNINLSTVKIDENEFSELIDKLRKTDIRNRPSLIRIFNSKNSLKPNLDIQKYGLYILALFCLVAISTTSFIGFWIIMITMGISALISRWFSGTVNKSKLRKYSEIYTFLGLINMVLILVLFKVYDYTANNTGILITSEIENHKNEKGIYPENLNDIMDNSQLNVFQKYVADKINYTKNKNDYTLELEFWNDNKKEFDKELKEWN